MVMKNGERWHCMNPECRALIAVEKSSTVDGANPRCTCGGLMKKEYASPVLSYLDFLRLDEPVSAARKPRES